MTILWNYRPGPAQLAAETFAGLLTSLTKNDFYLEVEFLLEKVEIKLYFLSRIFHQLKKFGFYLKVELISASGIL